MIAVLICESNGRSEEAKEQVEVEMSLFNQAKDFPFVI
jgi:hypothetical protein